MKKLLAMAMAACMAFTMVACGGAASSTASSAAATSEAASAESTTGAKTDVAFVTDVGNIDDQSFNQYTWQGVQDFCAANGLNANYYRPTEDSDAARIEQMDNAVADGAKAIVVAGYLFGSSIAEAQEKYPEVQFLALDVSAFDLGDKTAGANTALITYREEQAGYLAGYAAVIDGYKELGFLGGMAVPAVIRYGYGFVQGADAAAAEMNEQIEIKYWYCGAFSPSDDIKVKMSGWYSEGTEVVFSCGVGIYLSACAAAEEAGAKVIGVDVDQYYVSDTVITSAMKELKHSVVLALTDLYANDCVWPEAYAGTTATLGAADNCVGLPTADTSWRLNNFTVEEYEQLFEAIKSGEIVVSNDTTEAPAVTNSTVEYQE